MFSAEAFGRHFVKMGKAADGEASVSSLLSIRLSKLQFMNLMESKNFKGPKVKFL